jgi:hypothetical protein
VPDTTKEGLELFVSKPVTVECLASSSEELKALFHLEQALLLAPISKEAALDLLLLLCSKFDNRSSLRRSVR